MMTPHEAARLHEKKLEQAIEILKTNPDFPTAQVEVHDRHAELIRNLSREQSSCGTSERMELALEILRIQAEAYLKLVVDMESQEAYMTFVDEFGRGAFQMFTGFPLEDVVPAHSDALQRIHQRVSHWMHEGYRRLIPSPLMPIERTAPRRGYRAEVMAWMAAREIKTIPIAATALAVSETTLKNIMSDKGTVRYSGNTLERILKEIRPKGELESTHL